jgi:hypothetical protein
MWETPPNTVSTRRRLWRIDRSNQSNRRMNKTNQPIVEVSRKQFKPTHQWIVRGYMKQILLLVTIATTLASSALSAHSTTLSHDTVVDRSPAKIGQIALNPQPLPPRYLHDKSAQLGDIALNPQPLPPRYLHDKSAQLGDIALNPQPLPPRW